MTRATYVTGLLLLTGAAAGAQQPDAGRSLRLTVENDLIAVRGAGAPPDYDYTHGTDLFVDGNTSRASVGAERRSLVGQAEVGFGVRRRSYSIEYRHVARGREYRAQPGAHTYGSLALTVHGF
jgi:hypothetical protein